MVDPTSLISLYTSLDISNKVIQSALERAPSVTEEAMDHGNMKTSLLTLKTKKMSKNFFAMLSCN